MGRDDEDEFDAELDDDFDAIHGNHDPLWETEGREFLERVLEDIVIDEEEGVVRIPTEDGEKTFDDLWELTICLQVMTEDVMAVNSPYEGGSPVFHMDASGIVENLLPSDLEEFFESQRRRTETDGEVQFRASDLLTPPQQSVVAIDLSVINDELIAYFALHPDKMRTMHPRKFEELVAELLKNLGYDEVTLTPPSKDGGRDIHVFNKTALGSFLGFIECKRHNNPIQVGIVKQLRATVDEHRATFGAVVTTSTFTRGAKAFARKFEHQMKLHDHLALQSWLDQIKRKRGL